MRSFIEYKFEATSYSETDDLPDSHALQLDRVLYDSRRTLLDSSSRFPRLARVVVQHAP